MIEVTATDRELLLEIRDLLKEIHTVITAVPGRIELNESALSEEAYQRFKDDMNKAMMREPRGFAR
ncbi:hypothetical protein [Amycolatopsis pigmentata]|uniref:Uncharacterized protein n=1 Tax=Amycolatopsis pigmentata TaxID=450801 RepID=A0ABW5G427_9PSEU